MYDLSIPVASIVVVVIIIITLHSLLLWFAYRKLFALDKHCNKGTELLLLLFVHFL
jgi:hypothetical protein